MPSYVGLVITTAVLCSLSSLFANDLFTVSRASLTLSGDIPPLVAKRLYCSGVITKGFAPLSITAL